MGSLALTVCHVRASLNSAHFKQVGEQSKLVPLLYSPNWYGALGFSHIFRKYRRVLSCWSRLDEQDHTTATVVDIFNNVLD